MAEPTRTETIAAANAYEALFVPALFHQWASKVADAAAIHAGQRVLDVACGTGVLAREAGSRVGATGHVVGLDPNPGMLAVAARLAPGVEWREGVAESLPFAEGTFDAVVSQFGLMFFRDRRRGLQEMRRVLATGGRLVVAVWNSLDQIPAYASLVALLEATAGSRAADALRAPFALGDRKRLGVLASEAGIEPAAIRTHQGVAEFPSIRTMVEADLRGWLPIMGVILPDGQIEAILRQAEQALASYVTAGQRMVFPISAHLLIG
jgi:SAM-dependent methyltransferase